MERRSRKEEKTKKKGEKDIMNILSFLKLALGKGPYVGIIERVVLRSDKEQVINKKGSSASHDPFEIIDIRRGPHFLFFLTTRRSCFIK